ncbi:hypothetical protein IGK80_001134 [Enterococcus sp. DIV0609]|uniref:hypothetical protein n=1 Tax=unclassified Enterococcus TaxID=2608891 RepID=UPI003F26D4A5
MRKLMSITELADYFQTTPQEIQKYIEKNQIEAETIDYEGNELYRSEDSKAMKQYFESKKTVTSISEEVVEREKQMEPCMTITEASNLYQISYTKLQRLIKSYQIKPIYVGEKNKKYYAITILEKIITKEIQNMQNTVTTEFCKGKPTQSESVMQGETEGESVRNSITTEFCKDKPTQNVAEIQEETKGKSVQNTVTTEFCKDKPTQNVAEIQEETKEKSVQNTVTTEFCKDKPTQSVVEMQEETEGESVQNSVTAEFCKDKLTQSDSTIQEESEGNEEEEMSQIERQMYEEKIAYLERENQLLRDQLAHANTISNDVVKVLDQEQSLHLLSHKESEKILPTFKLPKLALEQLDEKKEQIEHSEKTLKNWWIERGNNK